MKTKNGFTLVELLAVVVILGILMTLSIPAVSRWIDKSKAESIESQRKTLLMAGQSYAQANTDYLPKMIGDSVEIPASQLKSANFLNGDIKDSNKKSCMEHSFVRIYKYDKTGYTYTAYIFCGNEIPPEEVSIKPKITISFVGEKTGTQTHNQNIKTSAVDIKIEGNTTAEGVPIGISSYRYVISVNYDNSAIADKVELFNSNDIMAGGRETIEIHKPLTDFENYVSITNFTVYVEAYNQDGGYLNKTADSSYKDTTGPECGKTTGEPGENEWNKEWRTKKISIECKDNNGSGCVKSVYSKTFKEQSEYGIIQIADNAGNTTDCTVRVHLDWTRPTLTINAYKINNDGSIGTRVKTITANNGTNTVNLNSYDTGYGTDSWLNNANFPKGVYYEVITTDNIKINQGVYSENAAGLTKNHADVNKLTEKATKTFTKTDNKTNFKLVDEGFRKGKYVLTDTSGNTVTINITAPIDRTIPVCGAFTNQAGVNEWTAAANRTISVACSDIISGCTATSYPKTFTAEAENGNIQIIDNAGNATNCTARVHLDRTSPTLTIVAYKRTANGGKGAQVGSVTANNAGKTKSITSYTGGVGGDSWLNAANFPYGVYYEVSTSDNYTLNSGTYSENARNIKKGGSGVDTLTAMANNNGESTTFFLEDEGYRKARYVLKDAAGNTVTVNITAPIDRTKPSVSASKSNLNTTSGVTVTLSCTDSLSGCDNVTKTDVKSTTSYTISDRAENVSDSVSVTVSAQPQYDSCSSGKRCSGAGCASESCHDEECTYRTWDCDKCYDAGGGCGHASPGGCDGGDWCGITTCRAKDSCKPAGCECNQYHQSISACGCASWNNSWTNTTSCSSSNSTRCRTVYN